jgi:Outer membrane protein transport protein (OMPP1/FadL/TodX)
VALGHFAATPALAGGELVALGTKTGVGARALSLGEAFTAVADDYSALHYNAAGMTQLRKSEIALNLGYGYLENQTSVMGGFGQNRNLESTRLNALTLILTDGGNWALGVGYHAPVSFDDPLGYTANGRDYAYLASGHLDQYRLGIAYKASEAVSLGLAVSAMGGTERLEIQDGTVERYLEEYRGFNLEPSMLLHLSKEVSLGASVVMLERLSLIDTWQRQGDLPVETRYDIRHPFQTRLGMAFQSNLTQISFDWHGDYWSSNSYSLAGAAFDEGHFEYPNLHTFAIGIEQHLNRYGPVLRGGLQWQVADASAPEPQSGNPWKVNVGFGFCPAKDLLLDVGYQLRGSEAWQSTLGNGSNDLRIAGEAHQVMGSMRFRF